MIQSCRLANTYFITAHNAFHPRRGQSLESLALEKLCINYSCKMVTDITLVHCMEQIPTSEAYRFSAGQEIPRI